MRGGEPSTPAREKDTPRVSRSDARRQAAEKRTALAPLRQRITTAEAAMTRLNSEIGKLDVALADPNLFTRDAAKAAALSKARSDAARTLEQAEEEWLAASAEYEREME